MLLNHKARLHHFRLVQKRQSEIETLMLLLLFFSPGAPEINLLLYTYLPQLR